MKHIVLLAIALIPACATPLDDGGPSGGGEGEGDAGEGEGDAGEGEGDAGEGEGDAGEGEGEGEGDIPGREGEGEGDVGGEGEGDPGSEGEGEGDPATPTCTSSHHWILGDLGTSLMHPGQSCIQCHAQHGGAPHYFAAGTVMGGVHDEDDCRGVSNVTVRVTGADGQVRESTTNLNGNFSFDSGIATPYTAEIEVGGVTRAMLTPQTDGDCMSCHTVVGRNLAPGRIVVPGAPLP